MKIAENKVPTKLFQLYHYYSVKENRDDKFVYNGVNIVHYDGYDIIVKDLRDDITEELAKTQFLKDMYKIEIEPYAHIERMTQKEIEEELGYKIEII